MVRHELRVANYRFIILMFIEIGIGTLIVTSCEQQSSNTFDPLFPELPGTYHSFESAFQNPDSVRYLEVYNIDSIPGRIEILTNLLELKAHGRLTKLPDEITTLKHLFSINIDDNRFQSIPEQLIRIRGLTVLSMNRNRVVLDSSFGRLINLYWLYLDSNGIRAIPQEIGNLKKMTILRMRNNPIDSLPPSILDCLKLRILDIRWTKIQWLPTEIWKLATLEELYITGCPISPQERARVIKLLPSTKVYWY